MKVEHEAKLDRNEMSMLRWICGFNLKDNKKNTEIRGLLLYSLLKDRHVPRAVKVLIYKSVLRPILIYQVPPGPEVDRVNDRWTTSRKLSKS